MINAKRNRKLLISAMAGIMMIPGSAITVRAVDDVPEEGALLPVAGIENVLEQCFENEVKENIDLYLVQNETGEYLNRAFSNVNDFVYIRTNPDETSEWIGKLYSDSTVTVLEYVGDWTRIQSGSVEGYVPADTLFTGEEAQMRQAEYIKRKATVTAYVLNVREGQGTEREILTQILKNQAYPVIGEPVNNWYPVQVGEISGWVSGEYITIEESFSYGESREEEEERLAAEEAARIEAEEAIQQNAAKQESAITASYISEQGGTGQAVIDFACQFIGNPYVWGGTSLTNGADCSGFVQSVYANFGVSLPRTSYEMRSAGYAVGYDEALPGDLILYEGHVGLYMGDGNIVNAMNEADGIGICSATYAPIIAVRRVL